MGPTADVDASFWKTVGDDSNLVLSLSCALVVVVVGVSLIPKARHAHLFSVVGWSYYYYYYCSSTMSSANDVLNVSVSFLPSDENTKSGHRPNGLNFLSKGHLINKGWNWRPCLSPK